MSLNYLNYECLNVVNIPGFFIYIYLDKYSSKQNSMTEHGVLVYPWDKSRWL